MALKLPSGYSDEVTASFAGDALAEALAAFAEWCKEIELDPSERETNLRLALEWHFSFSKGGTDAAE